MASWSARLVFLFVLVCFVASVCEGRRLRGGGSRGSRYRYRGGSSGSSSRGGGGGGDVGMILGIIFGSIGGIVLIIVMYYVCKTCVCNDKGTTKYSNRVTVAPYTSTNTSQAAATTTPTPYTHSIEANSNGDLPPSYDSAVNQKVGALPYAAQPPPAGGNPAPGIGFTAEGANGSAFTYSHDPPAPSAPS